MTFQEFEQKLISHGDNVLRFIRVGDVGSGSRSRFLGNILVSCRHYQEGIEEMYAVKVLPIANLASRATQAGEKLSLNKFEALINHSEHSIRLGPATGIQLEDMLQNSGIGTYALNWLMTELKKTVPNYSFNPFELTLSESMSTSAKELMVSFLNKFGISFNFVDIEQKAGTMRANTPAQIITHYNPDKIQELDLEEYLYQLITERQKNETELNNMKAEIERMGEESFGGIPKKQLVKYTLISCGVTIVIIFLLII
jgi:hypothetical protein